MNCFHKSHSGALLLLRHCSSKCPKIHNHAAIYQRLLSSSSSNCRIQNYSRSSSTMSNSDRRHTRSVLHHSCPLFLSDSKLCHIQHTSAFQSHNYSTISDFFSKFSTVNASEVIEEPKPSIAVTITPPSAPENVTESASTVSSPALDPMIEYIPIPPCPLPEGIDPSTLNAIGEPSMNSLGLGGWTPVGMFINVLEAVHVHTGLPWWGSIALITVCLRSMLFPLVVVSQKNAAKLNNVSPQMQVLQSKIADARKSGDQLNVARYSTELVNFMKEKDVNPMKSALVPLVQAPIFISVFVGLRRCANLPVVSMATGGMLWFTDLTTPDPNYLLPIITCATMALTIELGTEAGRMNVMTEASKIMFTAVRVMPLVILPFMINFPSALLCYWLTTNVCSLLQAGVLRIPAVRTYFDIEKVVKHNPDALPLTKKQKSKSTLQAAKDSWRDMKVVRELEDRQRYDEVKFAQAGTGPVVRTFKFDPTKVKDRNKNPPIDVKAKVKS